MAASVRASPRLKSFTTLTNADTHRLAPTWRPCASAPPSTWARSSSAAGGQAAQRSGRRRGRQAEPGQGAVGWQVPRAGRAPRWALARRRSACSGTSSPPRHLRGRQGAAAVGGGARDGSSRSACGYGRGLRPAPRHSGNEAVGPRRHWPNGKRLLVGGCRPALMEALSALSWCTGGGRRTAGLLAVGSRLGCSGRPREPGGDVPVGRARSRDKATMPCSRPAAAGPHNSYGDDGVTPRVQLVTWCTVPPSAGLGTTARRWTCGLRACCCT